MITQPNWRSLLKASVIVPARPAGLWTRVIDYVAGPRKLKIQVTGDQTWTIRADTPIGPQGGLLPAEATPGSPLLPAALHGALIAKIGGSAADNTVPASDGTPAQGVPIAFPVGDFCIVELTATQRGPLFLTMNDAPAHFAEHTGQLTVDIFEAL